MSERALAGAMLAFVNGALLGGYVYSKSSLGLEGKRQIIRPSIISVSYTHLTLPTKLEV